MRRQPSDHDVSDDSKKARALNQLKEDFSQALRVRFNTIESSIEDVWDLVTNKPALAQRLKDKVSPAAGTWVLNDMLDVALIAMFLWNDQDPPEVP